MSRNNNTRTNRSGRPGRRSGAGKTRTSGRGRSTKANRTGAKTRSNRRPGSGATRRPTGSAATRPSRQSTESAVRSIKFRVHKIECIKKTADPFSKDQMVFSAIKTMGKLVTRNGRSTVQPDNSRGMTINAGKFKKGDEVVFNEPKTLASFAIGAAKHPWPRTYSAAVLGVEKDNGKIKQVIDSLIEQFDDAAADKAGEAAAAAAAKAIASGASAGAAIGVIVPGLGNAAGAAVGAGVMALSSAIRASSEDDAFEPKGVQLKLDRAPREKGQIGSRKTVILKRKKARYKLICSWEAS